MLTKLIFSLVKSSLDCYTDTTTSWRVFLIWPTVVKGKMILLSSTTVVFCGLLGLLVLLSSPVCSFFLRMYQTFDLVCFGIYVFNDGRIIIFPGEENPLYNSWPDQEHSPGGERICVKVNNQEKGEYKLHELIKRLKKCS